ncbi:GAF and ANTAR domain-containing protein [Kineosporia succinea]|uniref:Transcriptional regulator with GAF, ATPase, and Fis domain n=1 Tax=Kineosporia succinea TaxID=84632 RepID=A0ABT9NZ34_9ACTN|nr:GAF and ANTAR domain-containing protein [Kineosporia succinea]MDP9825693.1 transcriptional regulator with GAF, ATPase, and Fis domain [Kineosporia succinea]
MTADPERDLRDSLTGLAEILTATQPLTETLLQVAAFAVSAIPGADGAGVTVLERQGPDTMVASDDLVRAVDAEQYGIGEGPCLLAVETRATQRSGSLARESRWPRFGPRAGGLGVHSALSLPLLVAGQPVGALNVYGRAHDAFDEQSAFIGEEFAKPAAVTASQALLLEESRRLAVQLEQALAGRATLDQAIGIIMSRTGKTAEEALATLREGSERDHVDIGEAATQIVLQALARARARREATE